MARRRFGIFKRASQEPVEETGDWESVGETGEADAIVGTEEWVAFSADVSDMVEASAQQEAEAQDAEAEAEADEAEVDAEQAEEPAVEGPPPLPEPEPEGSVAARVRGIAEQATKEAGAQSDELAALEQRVAEADASVTGELEIAERRVVEAEKRAAESERIARQAERRATAAQERAKNAEERIAALETESEDSAEPAPTGPSVSEELSELRAQVEDEARAAASRWLRGQLDAARESAEVRQAQAVERARAEAERETLERVGGSAETAAKLAAETDAAELTKLRAELAETKGELERAHAPQSGANGTNGHDPAVEEALAQAHAAQERAERAEAERAEAAEQAAADAERTAEAKLAAVRAELEAVQAELAESSPEAAQRVHEKLEAARRAAEESIGAELRQRTAQLDREREARIAATEAAEQRLRGIEQRAVEAAERIAVAERFLSAEPRGPGGVAVTGRVGLSEATYSELLAAGMSVAQAKRVLRRRAEQGPFESVDQLDELAEFAPQVSDELRSRLAP